MKRTKRTEVFLRMALILCLFVFVNVFFLRQSAALSRELFRDLVLLNGLIGAVLAFAIGGGACVVQMSKEARGIGPRGRR